MGRPWCKYRNTSTMQSSDGLVFVGDEQCAGSPNCTRTTRYIVGGRCLCGGHSRHLFDARVHLPLRPHHNTAYRASIDIATTENVARGMPGTIKLSSNNRWNFTDSPSGFVGVAFSNLRNCITLSSLSFDNCGQVSLRDGTICPSISHLIELSRLLTSEFDGTIKPAFWARMRKGFAERGFSGSKLRRSERLFLERFPAGASNPVTSLFVHIRGDDRPLVLTHLQFRALYCRVYEQLISENTEFAAMKSVIARGVNVLLWTSDDILHGSSPQDLFDAFMSDFPYFGAESALACMLLFENSEDLPWNVYRKRNAEIYQ